ncbi:hypothetical protein HanRHA438_Chr03g0145641 [Helianthus annuus]|nr:hypothetical protein HanRHA438_Chr03g0145641 [Helianthus annuus]
MNMKHTSSQIKRIIISILHYNILASNRNILLYSSFSTFEKEQENLEKTYIYLYSTKNYNIRLLYEYITQTRLCLLTSSCL